MLVKTWQRTMLTKIIILTIFLGAILTGLMAKNENNSLSIAAVGDPGQLKQRYESWKQGRSNQEGKGLYTLSLVPPTKNHLKNSDSARGNVHFNFATNNVTAHLSGLSMKEPLYLWVTNGISLSVSDQKSFSMRRVGKFQAQADDLFLEENITALLDEGFTIDQVVVSQSGISPLQSVVLAASPNLFQRLYAAEQNSNILATNSFNFIAVAQATEATGYPDVFNDLVTQGEDLFFNETFEGNGRSCGTCHPATNNFTIDNNFIATLPPNDPLFVAENLPALIFDNPANLDSNGNPQRFENPELMRAFGLIVENLDGMGDLENRFTMRSVPHNIGMSVSVTTAVNDPTPPDQRTGWSGDGAPTGLVGGVAASGRLRDFILGAIVQHYPLTPARRFDGSNPDFRVATLTELDALEAFLLSVGRQQELELRSGFAGELILKDAGAEAGKVLFRDGIPGAPTCQGCHGNAGANVLRNDPVNPTNNFGNRNFNTGVELFLRNRINNPNFTIVGEPRPVDGGFGTNPAGGFDTLVEQPNFINENFGNQTFNTVSLIEAADMSPFFHNNIIDNLEDAIRFYNSTEFMDPDNDGVMNRSGIPFDNTQVVQVANFLRAINALDNIENAALRFANRALQTLAIDPNPDDVIHRILQIAIADTQDAIEVLNEGGLHNTGDLQENAVKQLQKATNRFQQAMNITAADIARENHLQNAQAHLQNAANIMRF